ncbi:MAG: DUF6588 family protein [Gemmatimonadota bacterium]
MPRRKPHSPSLIALMGVLATALSAPGLEGQELVDQIRTLAFENAEGYVAPVGRSLAHALSDGFADRAAPLSALGFELGVRVVGARVAADGRSFPVVLPDSIRVQHPQLGQQVYLDPYRPREGALESPTAAGDGSGIVLVPAGRFEEDILAEGLDPSSPEFQLTLPDGLGLSLVPGLSFHAGLGLGMATEVTLHFLPGTEISPEIGHARAHGLGVRHQVSSWLPSPVDLTVAAGYQQATAGEYLEASAWHYGLQGGLKVGPLSFFAGSQMRSASTRLTFLVEPPSGSVTLPGIDGEVDIEVRGDRSPAWLLGANLQLLVLNLSGHYSFGSHDVFSLKLGLGLP